MSTVDAFLAILHIGKLSPEQEERKNKLREISYEQAYLTALANAEGKQTALEGIVGAEKHLAAIEKFVKEATTLAKAGKNKDAFEKLAPVNDLHTAGMNAHGAVRKEAETDYKPLLDAQRKIEQKLAADSWLCAEAKEEYRDDLTAAIAPLLKRPVAKDAVAKVKEALNAANQAIKNESHAAEQLAMAAELRLAEAAKELATLEKAGILQDIADVMRQKLSAESLFEQKLYSDAVDAATTARDEALAMQQELEQNLAAWRSAEPGLAAALDECKAHASQGCRIVETISPTVKEIETELKELQARKVGADVPYYAAIAVLERCRNQVASNKQRIEEFESLKDARDAADKKLQAAFEKTGALIIHAEGNLSRERDENIRLIEPNQLLAALKKQWAATLEMALTAEALDTSGIEAELTAIEADVAKSTDSDEGRDAAHKASLLASAMPKYELGLAAAHEKVAALRALGAAAVKVLKKTHQPDTLELGIAENFARSQRPGVHPQQIEMETKELNDVAKTADEAIAQVTKVMEERKAALAKQYKTVSVDLKNLEEKLVRYATSFLTKSPEYEKYIKALSGDLTAIDGMRDTTDLDMLELAEQELPLLAKRVNAAKDGIDSSDTKGETLQAASLQVSQAATDLFDADLTNYLAATKAELTEALEEIKSALLTTPVDVTLKKMVDWRKRFVAAQAKARAAKAASKQFLTAQKAAKKTLTDAKDQLLKAGAKELYEQLAKDFDKLAAAAGTEGALAGAQRDLDLLKQKVNDVLTKPDVLQARQGEAKKLAEQKEEDGVRWKAMYEDYRNKLLPQVKAAKVRADLYKELQEMGSSADKAFKRSKDFTTAEFQLKHARERARAAIEFPEGLELASRNQLPKVQAQWKTAVANFGKKIGELRKAVAAEDEEAAKSLDGPLKDVASLFNAGAFDAAIQTMLRADASADEKQAQREEALRNVRRFQRYVLSDFRLKELAANPFIKPFSGNFELNVALANLEKNLLTSL